MPRHAQEGNLFTRSRRRLLPLLLALHSAAVHAGLSVTQQTLHPEWQHVGKPSATSWLHTVSAHSSSLADLCGPLCIRYTTSTPHHHYAMMPPHHLAAPSRDPAINRGVVLLETQASAPAQTLPGGEASADVPLGLSGAHSIGVCFFAARRRLPGRAGMPPRPTYLQIITPIQPHSTLLWLLPSCFCTPDTLLRHRFPSTSHPTSCAQAAPSTSPKPSPQLLTACSLHAVPNTPSSPGPRRPSSCPQASKLARRCLPGGCLAALACYHHLSQRHITHR